MKYQQYKRVIEREYRMELKKVMHQLCIEEGLSAVEGSQKLGIAREVFVYWQYYYRFSVRQVLFDEITNNLKLPDTLK